MVKRTVTFGSKKNTEDTQENWKGVAENQARRGTLARPGRANKCGVNLQSIEDFSLGLAQFMVQRTIELDYAESWNYGCDRYPDYDIITRRYLAYCLESG